MSSSLGRHQRLPQNDPDNEVPQNRFHTIRDFNNSSGNDNGNAGNYQGAASNGGGGGNPLFACCTNCCNYLPLFCRVLVLVLLGGFIANFFPNVRSAVELYAYAIEDNFLNIYRILVCTYFGFLLSLFAILHIFQDTSMLEHKKGTIFVIHLWFFVSVSVNTLFFLLMLLVSSFAPDAALLVSLGPFPTLLGLIPLQLKLDGREERRLCCCNVPTKYYPWILVVMLSVLSFNLAAIPALVIGVLFGYAIVRFENTLTLSMITLRRWENGALSCLTHQSAFVSADAAASGNTPQPFSLQSLMTGGMAMPPQQAQSGQGRTFGSGTTGGTSGSEYYGMPPDEIEPDTMMEEKENGTTQPSVFASGTGHRLGGTSSTSNTSNAANGSRYTSFFTRSQSPATQAATADSASRAARIPAKGLNRLVENAYKQKPNPDIELSSSSSSSSTNASGAELSVAVASAVGDGSVDKSPLLAGVNQSDAMVVGEGGSGEDREKKIGKLVALGYSREDARNALIIADDDFEAAKQFLTTPLTSSI